MNVPQLDYPRTLFVEHQRPRGIVPALSIGLILVLTLTTIWTIVHRAGRPGIPAMLVVVTVLVAIMALFFAMRLTVTVSSHDLRISFVPFWWKRIPLHDIVDARVELYHPIREFGGWGIRWSLRDSSTCYTMHGTRGVRITTTKGRKLLIGSQRAEELLEAINAGRSTAA